MSMTYANTLLLEQIHSTDRVTDRYGNVKLNFLGVDNYYISKLGVVYNVYPYSRYSKNQYEDMIMLDPIVPVPWVLLEDTPFKWVPVNQLLGWAYSPYTEITPKYFLNALPNMWCSDIQTYTWRTNEDVAKYSDSQLYKFMQSIYKTI